MSQPTSPILTRNAAPVVLLFSLTGAFAICLYFHKEAYFLAALVAVGAFLLVIKRPDWGLGAALALMPLEAVGRVVPGVSELTYAKVVLVITLVAFAGQHMLRHEELRMPRMFYLLALLLPIELVSTLLFLEQGTPWGVIAFAGQLAVILLMFNMIKDTKAFWSIAAAIAVGSIPVVIVGAIETVIKRSLFGTVQTQFAASSDATSFRITSTFYDPNALGRYLLLAIVVTVCLALSKQRIGRYWTWPLVGAQIYCLVNSYSRGAFLSLAVLVILLILWERRIAAKGIRIALASSAVLIGVAALASELGLLVGRLKGDSSGLFAVDPSRIVIYRQALIAFWKSPVIGVGPDRVTSIIGEAFGQPVSPHNLYIETLLAVGVVGAALVAVFLTVSMLRGLRLRGGALDPYVRTGVLAVAASLLMGLTLHGFRENELWVSLGLLTAAAALPDPGSLEDTA